MIRTSKGQSLVELVLVAPLFAVFLWFSYQMTLLILCKLELISLTREVALAKDRLIDSSQDACQQFARQLAEANGKLDPEQLSVKISAQNPFLTEKASADSEPSGFMQSVSNKLFGAAVGEKCELTYHFTFSGLGRVFFPDGLDLSENVVSKSGTWKLTLDQAQLQSPTTPARPIPGGRIR